MHILHRLASAVEPAANLAARARLTAHDVDSGALSELRLEASLQVFLEGGAPVSPALRCVTVLTIFFFSVYLCAVFGRLIRILALCFSHRHVPHTTFEKKLTEASEALAIAPMMSIIMINARLRALQLDPSGGPERWVQLCMYASTAAFFLRFALDLALAGPKPAAGLQKKLLEVFYCAVSLVLYSCCFAILLNTVMMRHSGSTGLPNENSRIPPLMAMMRCTIALTATYLFENLLFEVMLALWRHYREVPIYFADEGARIEEGGERDRQGKSQLMTQPSKAEEWKMVELVSMQFPLMLCVLLAGITLRAMQLKLQPAGWASVAMYAATCSIVVQALWASSAAADRLAKSLSSTASISHAERSCFEWRHFNRNFQQLWPFAMQAQTPTPGGADAGAGVTRRPLHLCVAGVWVVMMACLYAGTTLILISVFTMEERPLSILYPDNKGAEVKLLSVHQREALMAIPPISVAMWCTMLLTVVYFGAYLCMMLGGCAPHAQPRRWAASVFNGVQRSLAFVPMLCVMMIAVRLRAMQLKVTDPQPWAQSAMYCATFAVIIQVGASLCSGANEDDDEAEMPVPDIAGKVATIGLLSVRYVAMAVLYCTVAALIAALLVMEPQA